MYLLNNLKIDISEPRVIGDVQYPRYWFHDEAHRTAVGITEVPDPVWPDPMLFHASQNPDGSLTITERTAEELAAEAGYRLQFLQESVIGATQTRLDDFAKTRGYDGILSASSYATSTVPKFAQEAQDCVALRDATWAALYALLDEVQAGTKPAPTSVDEVLTQLPELAWTSTPTP